MGPGASQTPQISSSFTGLYVLLDGHVGSRIGLLVQGVVTTGNISHVLGADGEGYWSANAPEAIGYIGRGGSTFDTTEAGRDLARACANSANHWRYVGGSKYSYVGIGVTVADGRVYVCIMVGTVDYG